jgi:hypothetical protein
MPAPHAGKVFKLHPKCGFVETEDASGTKTMQLIDKRIAGFPTFYPLSDTQAFILRLLILRVDTDHIKPMYLSEFQNVDANTADQDIQKVVDQLTSAGFLEAGAHRKKPRKDPQMPNAENFPGLPLDFSVARNSWGIWMIKLPLV